MSEVMRWKLKGFIPGVEGVSKALLQPWVVPAEDFDRITAERDALQQRLTVADQRADLLEGALRTSLLAMKRIYQAGYDRIVDAGGTCDTPEYMMAHDPAARELRTLLDAPTALGEIDLTPKRLAHAESVIEQQNNLISSLRAELVESYRVAAPPQGEPAQDDRGTLIGYGRCSGLDEASTLCTRMAYDAYYPAGTRFKVYTPKAQKALGDLLIKAANKIASLPDGPYDRFKARQAKKLESAKSR